MNEEKIIRHKYTDKDKYEVLQRPNVCHIFEEHGVKDFKYDMDMDM